MTPTSVPLARSLGNVLHFPGMEDIPRQPIPPVPPLEGLDARQTRTLLDVTRGVVDGTKSLVVFLDWNRSVAKAAGIEALIVELSAIVDGKRLEPLLDALEEASQAGKGCGISDEGFHYLRRAERLLTEAKDGISRFTGGTPHGVIPFHSLGAASLPSAPPPPSSDHTTIILAALGVVALAIIVLALKK